MHTKRVETIYSIFPHDSTDIFGIIQQFPQLHVECDSTQMESSPYPCANALDPNSRYHYASTYSPPSDAWYEVSFGTNIMITNYSIKSTDLTSRPDWKNPQSWKMYGISGSNETLIHTVVESGLVETYCVKTFPVDTIGVFEKAKIVLGKAYEGSNGGTDVLRIKQIDFFGSIGIPFTAICGKMQCIQRFRYLVILMFIME